MIRSPEKKAKERKALRMAVMISQLGICMMVPVFFCVFLGRWCSEKLGHPLIFLIFLLIGIMAGFRSCWQMIVRFTGPDLLKKKQEESDSGKMDKMD